MKTVKEMSLREKIGQLVFIGFPESYLTSEVKTLIEEYKVGNIILFVRNINDFAQIYKLNKEIHRLINKATDIMPLIAIDQEGGMVTRIMEGVTFPPGNMTLAATEPDWAYQTGKIVGTELRLLGINMNLAPVLDVNNNPYNPVIGVRSYSDNPETVSEYGLNYIRGLSETGIIATAKHFPGHGDTKLDSHHFLPTIPHDKNRLYQIELYPFRQAIRENVDAIMSAHVVFPACDNSGLPATLSKKVLTDLLRSELGFTGLIVSDCMEMKAIDNDFTTAKGALTGILAGLDMVFVSHSYQKQLETLRLLEAAVLSGDFPMEQLDDKVNRIVRYKAKIHPMIKRFFYDSTFKKIVSSVDFKKHQQMAVTIVDASLTKVKGKDFYPNAKTLLVAPDPFATTIAEDKLSSRSVVDAIRRLKLPIDTIKIPIVIDRSTIDEIVSKARYYRNVVVCTYNVGINQSQAEFVRKLYRVCADLFVISTRNPYDIFSFPEIENYLCVYEYTPNAVNTIVKYLNKEIYPTGHLPVKLKRGFTVGASLYVGLPEYSAHDNVNYLHMLKKMKIEKVFISAHMPEMNEFENDLHQITETADELGLKVILDVSRPTYNKYKIPKVYALRLDYGFTREEIVTMAAQTDCYLELNASTLDQDDLEYFLNRNIDLNRFRISHNFYPKPYTGLSYEEFLRKNRIFKRYGLKIAAFIPSQVGKRPPLYEGLPTIEAHRHLPLGSVLSDMFQSEIDEVFFGDAYASADELQTAIDFNEDKIIIPINIFPGLTDYEKNMLMRKHRNRRDLSPVLIRSSVREKKAKIVPRHTDKRKKFDVTIDNIKAGRYQGEVAIVLDNLPVDKSTNIIGKAIVSDFIIEKIKTGTVFEFVVRGEVPWVKR